MGTLIIAKKPRGFTIVNGKGQLWGLAPTIDRDNRSTGKKSRSEANEPLSIVAHGNSKTITGLHAL